MSETFSQPTPTCLLARFPDIKVHHLDLHPVRPWILFASKAGQVYLYDYEQNDILHTFSLNTVYDSKREEAQLLKVLEKNYNNVSLPDWYDDQLLQTQKLGDLKSIRLYDDDIVHWKLNEKEQDSNVIVSTTHNSQFEKVGRRLNLGGSSSDSLVDLGNVKKTAKAYVPSRKPKCIILQTETRVIMMRYDEVSSSLYFFDEVKNTQLDNKMIVCIEPLYTHPIIALGCSDGSIRLWNYKTKEVLKKVLVSQSKVTKMIAVHKEDVLTIYPSLLAVHENGTINMWNIDQQKADFSIPKIQGNITDMIVDWEKGHIISLGNDKSIFVRKLSTGEVVNSSKLKAGNVMKNVAKITTCNCLPSWLLMISEGNRKVYQISSDLNEATYSNSLDAIQFFPQKKTARNDKIYTIVQHQLQPNVIFLGTNFGLISFKMDYNRKPPVTVGMTREIAIEPVLPTTATPAPTLSGMPNLQLNSPQTPEHIDKNRRVVYYVKNQAIFQRFVEYEDNKEVYSEPAKVMTLPKIGNVQLGLSYSGFYLSILWEREQDYEIFSTITWKRQASGNSTHALVWSNAGDDRFAVLRGPPNAKAIAIYCIHKNSTHLITDHAPAPFAVRNIFGGNLLGVSSDDNAHEDTGFQFLSWNGKDKKGGALPRPRIVEWDQLSTKCVMVYDDSYAVFTYYPDFKIESYIKEKVETVKWWNGTLFVATQSEIKCIFPVRQQLYSVELASFDITHYSESSMGHDEDSLDPIPQPRPKGALSFVDVVGDILYVIDTNCTLHTLSVDTPSLKFRLLVSSNLVGKALSWIPYIPQELHDYCADFLVAHGHSEYACQIDTMTPSKRFQLCIQYLMVDEGFNALSQIDSAKPLHNLTREELAKLYVRLASIGEQQIDYLLKVENLLPDQQKYMEDMIETLEKCYKRATELEPSLFIQLIVFYTKHGETDKLRNLKQVILEKRNATTDNNNTIQVIDWNLLLSMIGLYTGDVSLMTSNLRAKVNLN